MNKYEGLMMSWGQNVKGMIFIYTRVTLPSWGIVKDFQEEVKEN